MSLSLIIATLQPQGMDSSLSSSGLPTGSLPPGASADESAAAFLPISVHMQHPDRAQLFDMDTSCQHAFTGDELQLAPCASTGDLPLRILSAMLLQHNPWHRNDLRVKASSSQWPETLLQLADRFFVAGLDPLSHA